jgi:hypothetical protein
MVKKISIFDHFLNQLSFDVCFLNAAYKEKNIISPKNKIE